METKAKPEDVTDILDIKFDSPNQIFIALAKRNYGKTVLCTNLLINLIENHKVSNIYVFSNTAHLSHSYDQFVKKEHIFNHDRMEEIIDKIITHQAKKEESKQKSVIVVIDDVILTNVSKKLAELATMGRHYNIGVIINVQYAKIFVSGIIRNNTNHWFIGEISKKNYEEIFHTWITRFHKFKEFDKYFADVLKKPIFIHYDSCQSDKEKRVQMIKCELLAKETKVFRIKK